ncbi:hypothetical protein E2P81_ATG05571 [Venturia nashicola]|nr:hypothetical protein E2P81_ATG05571 [Venturia nashicola]
MLIFNWKRRRTEKYMRTKQPMGQMRNILSKMKAFLNVTERDRTMKPKEREDIGKSLEIAIMLIWPANC